MEEITQPIDINRHFNQEAKKGNVLGYPGAGTGRTNAHWEDSEGYGANTK
ncbi:hypothetical protein NSPZN2_11555 [Nitrospira defluvii]|uniref:Uncharacterized protein n=1 Tax=Nitrospira defluvii TaxID=330214 RepID=A0ABM8QVS8_9BACT|nr:hypothetical protein NSPZN2_11555 [Nitrospira defluvii]